MPTSTNIPFSFRVKELRDVMPGLSGVKSPCLASGSILRRKLPDHERAGRDTTMGPVRSLMRWWLLSISSAGSIRSMRRSDIERLVHEVVGSAAFKLAHLCSLRSCRDADVRTLFMLLSLRTRSATCPYH